MSLQRVSGLYVVATPTPGAANSGVIPDSSVDAGPTADAPGNTSQDANNDIDAPTGNGNNPKDDSGCNIGASASWFGLLGLAAILVLRRRR
jgi:MYXO-CTERM domain-containing protein